MAKQPQQAPQPQEEAAQPIDGLGQIPETQNVEQGDVMYGFKGAWMPSVDPSLIGPENFQTLTNMRYNDGGIEGVNGYSFINSTSLGSDHIIKTGIQLQTPGYNTESYVIVRQSSDSDTVNRLDVNKTVIGSTGDFEEDMGPQVLSSRTDYLHLDSQGYLNGVLSKAPAGQIAYANGYENKIWGGEELPIAAAFSVTSASEATPIDVTDILNNSAPGVGTTVTIDDTGNDGITFMTLRPIHGFYIDINSANTGTGTTLKVEYWSEGSYHTISSNITDGTEVSGQTLEQDGWIRFNWYYEATPRHFEGRYLYCYRISTFGGSADAYATINRITYDAPMQQISNVWDGVYRTPIQCQLYTDDDEAYEDFTLHVSEASNVNLPVGCIMNGFVGSTTAPTDYDKLILMFDEPMSGFRFTMLGNLINTTASVMTVKYWDGDSFEDASETDGTATSSSTITLGQSGLIYWEPPSDEEKTTLFGVQGYAYEITVDVTLDGTKGDDEAVVIDIINGVPARKNVNAFKFPVTYKNKLMLCSYDLGNEYNRIDYSVDNAPDIFNGEESSLDGYQSIYVGSSEPLTCATQLYNRFGSNLFTSLAIFKNHELYLLTGDGPIDYKLYPVSYKIGCPCPYSLTTAEVGFELGEDVARNVAIFISNSGPMMYDGAVLYPLRGIENYFDPNDSDYINTTYLHEFQGWFDSNYKEYNMLIMTGSNTTFDKWLCYDLVRKKWFRKNTNTGDKVTCGFQVSDDNGNLLIYGGTAIGKMAYLENGTAWDDSDIQNVVQTGDIFPSQNEWDITRIRRMKLVTKRLGEADQYASFYHYTNTEGTTPDNTESFDMSASGGSEGATTQRLTRSTKNVNVTGWCHSFKWVYSSDTVAKGFQPMMWGYQWENVRKDHDDI